MATDGSVGGGGRPVFRRANTISVSQVGAHLDDVLADIRTVDAGVQDVRERHQAFLVAASAWQAPGGDELLSKSSAADVAASASKAPKQPLAKRALSTSEALEKACGHMRVSETGRITAMTRAQVWALDRFHDIDDGKMEPAAVFDRVPVDARRIETKCDFYRERFELVLPRIEERFVRRLPAGDEVVDLVKLRAGEGRANSPPRTPRLALSPSPSVESLPQRIERIACMGQMRDGRIHSARDAERHLLKSKRLAQLDSLERKTGRRDVANRDRRLLTWVVAAMAMQTMNSIFKSFVAVYQDLEDRGRVTWDTDVDENDDYFDDSGLLQQPSMLPLRRSSKMALVSSIQHRVSYDICRLRRKKAYDAWRNVLRVIKFYIRLRQRNRRNLQAELIKKLIDDVWRGYTIRVSVRGFLAKTRFLQRAIRACLKWREHVRYNIYLPSIWEMETQILGSLVGFPKGILNAETQAHRAAWDIKERVQEALDLHHLLRLEWKRIACPISKQRRSSLLRKGVVPQRQGLAKGALRDSVKSLQSIVSFSESGKATMLAHSKAPTSHPMMQTLEKYRLSTEVRHEVMNSMFRESIERWWKSYSEYKARVHEANKMWHDWRMEASFLGSHMRCAWPLAPPVPKQAQEVLHIEPLWLRTRVAAALKSNSAAAQLLDKP